MTKHLTGAAILLLTVGLAGSASAASFSRNPNGPKVPKGGSAAPSILAPATITESTNTATITAGSVSCNTGAPGFFHVDNDYARSFHLASFPALNQPAFTVQSVTVGIEQANDGAGTGQPITLRLAEGDGNPIGEPAPGGTLLSTDALTIADQALTLFVMNVAVPPTLTVATDDLVVDVFTPDGTALSNSLFIGSNGLGQSAPSFILAAGCGLTTFNNIATIGFPNMHIVMTVSGDTVPVELQTFQVE